ncbi:MAG: glycosyltransferase family 2 protein [Planctomycetota bacterium]|jgi:GT2 family glycosyltransferase
MVRISVIIPTRGRPDKIASCLRTLSEQTLPRAEYEVLVGIDDDDPRLAQQLNTLADDLQLTESIYIDCAPNSGQASVRNRLLPRARADTLLFLNDDMVPTPDLLEKHLAAQDRFTTLSSPVMIIGDSPWVVPEPDNLFAQLVRETSMVFFYNRMRDKPADHDFGFRHAWTLNLSVPTQIVRDAGGFTVFPSTYGFEDDELAWRLARQHNARVLYTPDAVATHDHILTPKDYILREMKLGHSAWGFARTTPECAHEMYNCDIANNARMGEYRSKVADFPRLHEGLISWFLGLGEESAFAASEEGRAHNLGEYYQKHLALKRYCWARGILGASEGQAMPTGLCLSAAPSTLG